VTVQGKTAGIRPQKDVLIKHFADRQKYILKGTSVVEGLILHMTLYLIDVVTSLASPASTTYK
jgi:hypothetical protein